MNPKLLEAYNKNIREIEKAQEGHHCAQLVGGNGRTYYYIRENHSLTLYSGGFSSYQAAWLWFIGKEFKA